jgi:hypothetical protein
MALFARRRMQEAIDHCASFMPPEAMARKVAELNICNEKSLAAEWEIMIAAAASRLCPLAYEPPLGGSRHGDLLLTPHGRGTPGCLVEITTISDRAAHGRNRLEEVEKAIQNKLRKLGCPDGTTHLQVGGSTEGEHGDAQMVLHLGSGQTHELFDERFREFAREIKAAPDREHRFQWKGPKLDIELTFTPGGRFAGAGYPSYTTTYSRERNPLFSALRNKKRQLVATGHPGPFGVVVCDGGCHLLNSSMYSAGGAFSITDVVEAQFRDSEKLSFVLTIHAEQPLGNWRERPVLKVKPFFRAGAPEVVRDVLQRLLTLPSVLPRPVLTAQNAARCYTDKWVSRGKHGRHGRMNMSDRSVRLSARAVLEMLAQKKTPAEFFAEFPGKHPLGGNYFAERLREGRLITRVDFVKGQEDDDEIEFTFGPPDAAVVPFRAPAVGVSADAGPRHSGVTAGRPSEPQGAPASP